MATLRQIADEVIRMREGGISVDESKYDLAYIYSLIHQARAQAIFTQWQKVKRINNEWTQQYIPEYLEQLQGSSCVVIFPCPSFISMDSKMDGLLYVGTVDGECAYRKVETRAKLASFNKYRYTNGDKHHAKVLYSDGMIEIHHNIFIEEVRVDGIFNNPAEVPGFNIDYDRYPVDALLMEQIKVILMSQDLKPQVGPIDVKSDSQSTINAQQGGAK